MGIDNVGLKPEHIIAVAKRPDLWKVGVSSALSMAPTGWWRKAPFLPLPDKNWMHFRLETQYGGDGTGPIEPQDLITWLEWRKDFAVT